MDTKWLIIFFVVMSLVGSIAWALPTPTQRAQGKLRAMAMRKGLRVNVSNLTIPRERGCVEKQTRLATSYRLFREEAQIKALRANAKTQPNKPWQAFKAAGLETQGLPEHWCWQEPTALMDSQLTVLAQLIAELPNNVYAINSNEMFVAVYWDEQGTPASVQAIYDTLVKLRELL